MASIATAFCGPDAWRCASSHLHGSSCKERDLPGVRRPAASSPPPGANLRAVNTSDEATQGEAADTPATEPAGPGRVKRAALKPWEAAKAVGGGFKWAGGGVARQTKAAGHAVGTKLHGAGAAPKKGFLARFGENPWLGIGAI